MKIRANSSFMQHNDDVLSILPFCTVILLQHPELATLCVCCVLFAACFFFGPPCFLNFKLFLTTVHHGRATFFDTLIMLVYFIVMGVNAISEVSVKCLSMLSERVGLMFFRCEADFF